MQTDYSIWDKYRSNGMYKNIPYFHREHDSNNENRPGTEILMSLTVQAVKLYLAVLELEDRTSEKS